MNYKKQIFTGIFWCMFLGVELLYFGWMSGIMTLISIFCYGCILYGCYILWKYMRKTAKIGWRDFFGLFLYKTGLILSTCMVVVGSFLVYNNEIQPAAMPTYFISNGQQDIIFQAMIHIAEPQFYNDVIQNITEAKRSGYVYFFEGVRPGSPENTEIFYEALGVEIDPETYDQLSELYGVVAQDQSKLLGIENNLDFNIDMNLDEIVETYISITGKTPEPQGVSVNIEDEIIGQFQRLSEPQKKLLVYFNQAILNFFTRHEGLRNILVEQFEKTDIFHVIIDERNQRLVEEVQVSEYNKIFITYGLMHFEGFFEILRATDPKWHIKKIDYLFPIQ